MENEKKEMTIEEVVRKVIADLSAISVPIGLTAQIAGPIFQAVENLKMCIRAWEQSASQKNE